MNLSYPLPLDRMQSEGPAFSPCAIPDWMIEVCIILYTIPEYSVTRGKLSNKWEFCFPSSRLAKWQTGKVGLSASRKSLISKVLLSWGVFANVASRWQSGQVPPPNLTAFRQPDSLSNGFLINILAPRLGNFRFSTHGHTRSIRPNILRTVRCSARGADRAPAAEPSACRGRRPGAVAGTSLARAPRRWISGRPGAGLCLPRRVVRRPQQRFLAAPGRRPAPGRRTLSIWRRSVHLHDRRRLLGQSRLAVRLAAVCWVQPG